MARSESYSVDAGESVASSNARQWLGVLVFATCLGIYAATLAPGTLFGDPSEYQFIPAIWGIAHPPGYAVYTLVAGVWQRLVAVGTVAYRTNLLAAVMGAWTATRIALATHTVLRRITEPAGSGLWTALFAGLSGLVAGLAPDVWQHSIHSNAHIMSAAITSTQLWALIRWWASGRDGWLYLLAVLVGVGVTHHPITVWGVPAYVAFIVLSRPRIVTEWRTILSGMLCVALGMLPWLYFPLRSPSAPFGPTDMATWEGFLRHATAQGLRVNLFHFGIADQPDRLQVFASVLGLQYGWLFLGAALLGVVRLMVTAPRLGVLWLGYVGGHLAFTLNSVQDVMAYLLHPFVAFGLPIGLGAQLVWQLCQRRGTRPTVARLAAAAFAGLLLGRAVWLLPRISLRQWRDADDFVADLTQTFRDEKLGATLVSDWEHLTPYFYYTYVAGLSVDPQDLEYVYVTGATPWVESVFGSLAEGPTYLSNYRRDIRDLGFRLRPALGGRLWEVLEPPATSAPMPQHEVAGASVDDNLELIGYDVATTQAHPGDVIPVTVYARVIATETDIIMPMARLGNVEQRWTTDSRRLTPEWRPGETIAEQYRVYVPFDAREGALPLTLSYRNLSAGGEILPFGDGQHAIELAAITVERDRKDGGAAQVATRAHTNIGNQVALTAVRARAGLSLRHGLWERPLEIAAGQPLHLRLAWYVLTRPTTSYTVFIHLIDGEGRLWYGHDYTPLGGAFPSYLWFPKWLPGQRAVDPYRLVLPADLPTGTYWLEVGMYEMGSIRRIAQLGRDGTMTGDRLILGSVVVHD